MPQDYGRGENPPASCRPNVVTLEVAGGFSTRVLSRLLSLTNKSSQLGLPLSVGMPSSLPVSGTLSWRLASLTLNEVLSPKKNKKEFKKNYQEFKSAFGCALCRKKNSQFQHEIQT